MCLSLKDIKEVIEALPDYLNKRDSGRPYFFSEADFQHAFAITIGKLHNNLKVWLEYPIEDPLRLEANNMWYIDICVMDQAKGNDVKKCFIELKYKTKAVDGLILKNQSAQDLGRMLFLKDVSRIENAIEAEKCNVGYTILLTNDHLYWEPPKRAQVHDLYYRLHQQVDAQENNEPIPWNADHRPEWVDSVGLVTISNNYMPQWTDYNTVNGSLFRSLVFEVPPNKGI